jgi:hypothetical protein
MFKGLATSHRARRPGSPWALALACALLVLATACAPASQPTPTPEPTVTPVPSPQPTWTPAPVPTPTAPGPQVGTIEGLVLNDNGQLIIGVDWTSKSRITYLVQSTDTEAVRQFLGETARVTGEIVDRSPWLKEIVVRTVEGSAAAGRLSWRAGYIAELGDSIYMQGTHVLINRDADLICLLEVQEGGPDLDSYSGVGRVAVTGIMTNTVEGNAQIMEVKLVEKVE